ncbi:sorbosone dehydrogenase family protein [Sphingomonas naphthae]|uniref:Sorbosone dehydrogenase family protein n=1 Tax=Sphingomonas naphthae TaxID=1813468 RepID=A0ABY7TG94_9SPHN|nr:sorbosone dehydrogenase family protein [Sphingomonas naphthae]WCT71846.1 sorbosone dehydrogenase family protein [Sphingomonas naphthae]
MILALAAQAALAATPAPAAPTPPPLPAPYATPSVEKRSVTVGWPEGGRPKAPEGFEVLPFATGLSSPRQMLVLANGDVLVAEAQTIKNGKTSANRITLLRDDNRDGKADQSFTVAENIRQPFGLAIVGPDLWIAATDGVLRAPFKPGDTTLGGPIEQILALPAGGYNNHWTRNLIASPDGKTVYLTIGSASNIAEHGPAEDQGRAEIRAIDVATRKATPFATGLRNPVGLAFEPTSGALWTAVNERDGLGDELVPDYITSVRAGGFYGWPYSYFGKTIDPRVKQDKPDLVARAIVPDLAVGPHVAALGIAFAPQAWPAGWTQGAFVARHGSWNRAKFSGYDVVFAPFANGKPTGEIRPFLTGFVSDEAKSEVFGRPVSLATTATGALLLADDAGNAIWLVRPVAAKAPVAAPPTAAPVSPSGPPQ